MATLEELRKLKKLVSSSKQAERLGIVGTAKLIKGDTGDKGEKGEKGDQGEKGEKGDQGIQGVPGENGVNGLDGLNGKDGKDGKQGLRGLKGEKGEKGDRGEKGKDGKDGNEIEPKEIVDKLESLVGNKRLDASAIKNLDKKLKDSKLSLTGFGGGSSGSSTFKELTDTPATYEDNASKFVKVKADETGLEFATSTATVAWDGITGNQALINLSGFTNDSGFITTFTETDPVFTASEASNFATGDKLKLDGIEDNANNYVLEEHDNTKHSTNYEPEFSKNTAFNKNFGTTVGTVTQGNDARLSDDRTPLSHGNEKHSATFITADDIPAIPTNSDFDLADLGDVVNTAKAEGKILKVDALGNHEYVDDELGTDEKVKFDSEDPTAGYITDKVIAGDGISVAEGTGGNANKLVITNDDKGSDVSVPEAATEAPSNHGTAAVGISAKYAKEDHVHNSDNTDTTYTAGTGLTLTGTQFTSNDSQINHNSLSNTHNLTTDIDHNALTNYAVGEHRTINDLATGTTDLWSASKINTELGGKLANIESESIGDLSDVDLTTIATGDLLQWDGSKFVKYTFSATGTQVPLS